MAPGNMTPGNKGDENQYYDQVEELIKNMPKGDYPEEMRLARRQKLIDEVHAANDEFDEARRRRIVWIFIGLVLLLLCLVTIISLPR